MSVGDHLNQADGHGKTQPTVGDIIPYARDPGLYKSREIQPSMSKQVCVYQFPSAPDCGYDMTTCLSTCLHFSTMMDCNLDLLAETNPSSPKYFYQGTLTQPQK